MDDWSDAAARVHNIPLAVIRGGRPGGRSGGRDRLLRGFRGGVGQLRAGSSCGSTGCAPGRRRIEVAPLRRALRSRLDDRGAERRGADAVPERLAAPRRAGRRAHGAGLAGGDARLRPRGLRPLQRRKAARDLDVARPAELVDDLQVREPVAAGDEDRRVAREADRIAGDGGDHRDAATRRARGPGPRRRRGAGRSPPRRSGRVRRGSAGGGRGRAPRSSTRFRPGAARQPASSAASIAASPSTAWTSAVSASGSGNVPQPAKRSATRRASPTVLRTAAVSAAAPSAVGLQERAGRGDDAGAAEGLRRRAAQRDRLAVPGEAREVMGVGERGEVAAQVGVERLAAGGVDVEAGVRRA